MIGFDDQDRLLIGTMTGEEAIAAGVRDAVAWGPVLIVNGEPYGGRWCGGGLNPPLCDRSTFRRSCLAAGHRRKADQ